MPLRCRQGHRTQCSKKKNTADKELPIELCWKRWKEVLFDYIIIGLPLANNSNTHFIMGHTTYAQYITISRHNVNIITWERDYLKSHLWNAMP